MRAGPTRRLRPAARAARRACAQWERYGRLVHRFFDLNDFSVGIAMSAGETRANEAQMATLDRIEALMWESRHLPRLDDARDRSCNQPRDARVARRLTSRRLDIRCWDEADWARVQREAAAFEDVGSVDVDGYANFSSGHIVNRPWCGTRCG